MVLQPVDNASQHSDTTVDIDTPSEASLSPMEEKMLFSPPPTYTDSEKTSQSNNHFPTQQEAHDRRSKKIQRWITVLCNIRLLLIAITLVLGAGYVSQSIRSYCSLTLAQAPPAPQSLLGSPPSDSATYGMPDALPLPHPTPCADNDEYESSSNRKTVIRGGTHSITGTFTLLDLLELTTSTGRIEVGIKAGPDVKDHPSAARFFARSHTGSIIAHFQGLISQIPSRDYSTEISTDTGSISGAYVLGGSTSFTTETGSISVSLLPVRSSGSDWAPKYHSRTSTGPQTVTIYESDDSGEMMKKVEMRMASGTGTLTLKLPADFEGRIIANSGTGSVEVTGSGLKVVRRSTGDVEAVKGEGKSVVELRSGTGRIDVVVG